MKKSVLLLILLFFIVKANAQSTLYFPPIIGQTWDTLSPQSLGWCSDKIDTLHNFLAQKNTKAFIVLKDGKIVIEDYFGTFTRDSIWYWASAAKSLFSALVGIAQQEGLIDINNATSQYLGNGWTTCTPVQEQNITILNQLTMTTGLDDGVADDNCFIDTCLQYLTPAGMRWAYHNAPYTLLHKVIDTTSRMNINQFTQSRLGAAIGFSGLWFLTNNFTETFYSNARAMARFGLLMMNKGVWQNDSVLTDTSYLYNSTNTSQLHNESYGYLWWLNGKSSYMLPGVQFVFPGSLAPAAPPDMYAALGKNDQKIHIIPSLNMVVVRMGNAADSSFAAVNNFDNQIWEKLNDVFCPLTIIENNRTDVINIYPNPTFEEVYINTTIELKNIWMIDMSAREWKLELNKNITLSHLAKGIYFLKILDEAGKFYYKRIEKM